MRGALIPLLLAAFLMLHDAGLAMHGHGAEAASPSLAESHAVHGSDHPGDAPPDGGSGTDDIEQPCGVLRLTPAWTFADDVPLTSMHAELLPIAQALATFAAVSPSLVDHPPVYAPATLRALYEVYRI